MKIFYKLFVWAILLSGCGQVALAQQNYFAPGVPPSSISFAPTFRYITGSTDSLNSLFLAIGGNKWYRISNSITYFQRAMVTGTGTYTDPFGIANNYITPAMMYSTYGSPSSGTVYFGNHGWASVASGITWTAGMFTGSGIPGSAYNWGTSTIPNSTLVNSGITLNGTSTPLGGSFTVTKNNTDTTSTGFQTVSNFFPKGDTRYVKISSPQLTTSSTTTYVWTATDAFGHGSWQVASGGGTTTNPLTFSSGGAGDSPGTIFNGALSRTISYNSIGAVPTSRQVIAGIYTTGGGTLTSDVTINADTTTGKLATQYYASKVVGADGIITGLVTTTVTTTATTTAGTYRLNNLLIIKSTSTNTTIDAQDASLNRYDLIVADASGVLTKISGTLATDAVEPDIPTNKALIASIYIPAVGGTVTTGGGGNGKGTLTKITGVNANGFTWSIANSTTTPAITLTLQNATTSQSGQLTSTDWNTFNNKQASLGFTAENVANKATTFGTLNNTLYPSTQAVSNYVTGFGYLPATTAATTYVPLTRTITINGTTLDLSANRSWTVSGGGGTYTANETPTGSVNSSNTSFALAHTPVSGTVSLFLNGVYQTDYTISSGTVTFTSAPLTGDVLRAIYTY